MRNKALVCLGVSFTFCLTLVQAGCTSKPAKEPVSYFKVDSSTAGEVSGTVRYTGKQPAAKPIDMDQDPACVRLHGKQIVPDESVSINANGTLANVFVYVKAGLEGKKFQPPSTPVAIDQKGCWFHPRVIGIQAGQILTVSNSDPVTHNIHPLAHINREWNQSQSEGDPPLKRRFVRQEIMIPVKCNIHGWMRSFIGVVDHPYFAVNGTDGSFHIKNLPPGSYTVEAWHEKFGTQQQQVTLSPSGSVSATFTFTGD